MPDPKAISALHRIVEGARAGVVFTGAGISTESGIPDFRSPGGLWAKYRPIDFGEFVASAEARREAWRRRFAMSEVLNAARPNAGHYAIRRLVDAGKVAAVVTQNIDGLDEASGVPKERIVELHGNTMYAECLDCRRRYEIDDVRRRFEESGGAPDCDDCGGFVKTATVSFGQSMPEIAMRRAETATLACDVFLAIGSSLVVYPAAGFPILAKRCGARLVIVNREPTELDELADLVIHGEIGATLGALLTPESAPLAAKGRS